MAVSKLASLSANAHVRQQNVIRIVDVAETHAVIWYSDCIIPSSCSLTIYNGIVRTSGLCKGSGWVISKGTTGPNLHSAVESSITPPSLGVLWCSNDERGMDSGARLCVSLQHREVIPCSSGYLHIHWGLGYSLFECHVNPSKYR